MLQLQPRLQDNRIKELYFEGYYQLTYCIYHNALAQSDAKTKQKELRLAANYILKLENQPDPAAEPCKKRLRELLTEASARKGRVRVPQEGGPVMLAERNQFLGHLPRFCLAFGLLLAAWPAVSRAQDEIQYFDRAGKSIVAVQALIEQENINGLRFRVGARGEPVDVSAPDLVDVVYSVPGSLRLILTRARNEEKKEPGSGATQPERLQAIAQAIKEYQGLLKEGEQTSSAAARRHWQFRIARLRRKQPPRIRAETKAAVAELTAFVRQNDSWQTVAAASLLVRIQADGGDFDAAAQALRQVLNGKGLSPTAKRDQAREIILVNLLGKNLKAASAAIDALRVETPATGSEPLRLRVLEALRDAVDGKPELRTQSDRRTWKPGEGPSGSRFSLVVARLLRDLGRARRPSADGRFCALIKFLARIRRLMQKRWSNWSGSSRPAAIGPRQNSTAPNFRRDFAG